jgi:periplasmic protein CpxP/Spy
MESLGTLKARKDASELKSATFQGEVPMTLTVQEREHVMTELKGFAKDLNLTDQQKEKLQSALGEAREKVQEYLKKNPTTTRADIIAKVKAHREEIGKRIAAFLSPEQLTKWNAEVAKAKEFLGQKLDAA